MTLSSTIISSPLGDLYALASEKHLLMLEFADSRELERKISLISSRFPLPGEVSGEDHSILHHTKLELAEYFVGKRKIFTLPYRFLLGTAFQQKAWQALTTIPYGETRSYKEEALLAGNPKAIRAIGGANNKNPIVIIIPCHRVIGADGKLVGYGGGIERKKWLLEHEKKYISLYETSMSDSLSFAG